MLSLTVTDIYLETKISQFGDGDQYCLFVMGKMLVSVFSHRIHTGHLNLSKNENFRILLTFKTF